MTSLEIAFSPCPNDLYAFHGWTSGQIASSLTCQVSLLDIQSLNQALLAQEAHISKVSILAFARSAAHYIMLPVGSALGYGVGPKLVGRHGAAQRSLASKRILVPGRDTTAYLALRLLFAEEACDIEFCDFRSIVPRLVEGGDDELGLIINESRFELESHGLSELADLGELWFKKTGLALPLGCLVAKRSIPAATLQEVCHSVRRSIDYARANEQLLHEPILKHSQEKNIDAAFEHVRLYVNDDTYQLSSKGEVAISLFLQQAAREGMISALPDDLIFKETRGEIRNSLHNLL